MRELKQKRAWCSRECEIKQRSCKTRKWGCSDLCNFFISTPETAEKTKPTNFYRKYECWQLRVLGKIVNLFHNNMQARYTLLMKKNRQSLCLARTQTWFQVILLFAVWWNAFVLFHCPLAITTVSHTFVIFNSSHMQTATPQVHLDFLLPL